MRTSVALNKNHLNEFAFLRAVLLVLIVNLFAGCGSGRFIEDRSDHYMLAQPGGNMVVPEWYSDRRLRDRYPIPKADKSFVHADEFKVPAPPEPGIAILAQQFVVKTSLEDIWLLASEPPGKMWPALKAYWEFYGAEVIELNTSTGVMAVTFQSSSLKARQFMDRYGLLSFGEVVMLDVLVEQGLKRRSSEIRIDAIAGKPVVKILEKQLLTNVSQYMANRTDSFESYSLAAQNIGSQDKLVLINEPDKLYLKVDLNFERAWHAVGEALARSKIPIIDWNRKQGTFYVSYQTAENEESWLPEWFNFNGEDKLTDSFNFKIELSDSADGIHIVSVPVSGAVDDQDRIRLLNELLDHMS